MDAEILNALVENSVSNPPSRDFAMKIFENKGVGAIEFLADDAFHDRAVMDSLIQAADHVEAPNSIKNSWQCTLSKLVTAARVATSPAQVGAFDPEAEKDKIVGILWRTLRLT